MRFIRNLLIAFSFMIAMVGTPIAVISLAEYLGLTGNVFLRVLVVFGSIAAGVIAVLIVHKLSYRYAKGRNPYHRICKKCGQHQNMMSLSYDPAITWWEEVYPEGNNPKCSCKYDTRYVP